MLHTRRGGSLGILKGVFWGQEGGVYTREMGTICPFGVFFSLFYSFFRFKIGHFPFKT